MTSRRSTILRTLCIGALLIIPAPSARAQEASGGEPADVSLRNEVDHVIHRCLVLLEKEQEFDGYWSSPDYPGMTALILRAFLESPVDRAKWQNSKSTAKAIAFLKTNVQEDGGIYKRGLYSYNTAISLMCLNVYSEAAKKNDWGEKEDRAKLEAIMIRARTFLVKQQQIYSEDDFKAFSGGIGYGNSYKHSDLSNTALAIQALHETRHLVEKSESPVKLDWDAAIQFLQNTQNLPAVNKQTWASDDPDNRGGFVYFPGDSKAGTVELPSGKTALRSYGSMSYAGLMSMIYAGVDKKDERVIAAVDWLKAHYTLDENPSMGQEGLYYYYYTMAKALDAWGEDTLTLADGRKVEWRSALAKKLVSLHKHPGYWVNENSRWMESDPYLVSAYALLTLNIIYPYL